VLASVMSKRASSAPDAASVTSRCRPGTLPNGPPSAEAPMSTRSTSPGTFDTSIRTVSEPAALPAWLTAPLGCDGWL
jgi:hypothetical protein